MRWAEDRFGGRLARLARAVAPETGVEVVAPGLAGALIAGAAVPAAVPALEEAAPPLCRPRWVSDRDVCASVASACELAYAHSGSLRPRRQGWARRGSWVARANGAVAPLPLCRGSLAQICPWCVIVGLCSIEVTYGVLHAPVIRQARTR